MRLITRRDTSLAVALIMGTLVAFQRPFSWLLDLAHDLGQRYHIDLLPALTLLTAVFVFHQYNKRLQAKAELMALASEMAQSRARAEELERLMLFGQSLANAFDRRSLEQAIWRALPKFIGDRECSVLARQPAGFELLLRDPLTVHRLSNDALETLVLRAAADASCDAAREGVAAGDELCFPLMAGATVLGAIVVRNEPVLTKRERAAVGAAGALIAVATRNLHVLNDARQSSVRDGLTGCFTRAHALEVLESELRRAKRTGTPVSVVMFDIDGFKRINDRSGHLQGDAVLASVGQQLTQVLRSTDVRCRYGGDEFLLILPDTPILGAQQVAECLRREIGAATRDADGQLRVTASLGVASAASGELDATAIIARADEALYRAKRGGRNRYCVTTGPRVAPVASGPQLVHAAG